MIISCKCGGPEVYKAGKIDERSTDSFSHPDRAAPVFNTQQHYHK